MTKVEPASPLAVERALRALCSALKTMILNSAAELCADRRTNKLIDCSLTGFPFAFFTYGHLWLELMNGVLLPLVALVRQVFLLRPEATSATSAVIAMIIIISVRFFRVVPSLNRWCCYLVITAAVASVIAVVSLLVVILRQSL